MQNADPLKALITSFPDFPTPGILFRDVSPLLFDVSERNKILEKFWEFIQEKKIDAIAGVDARGFVLGGMLSEKFQLPFMMIRKDGKLPDQLVEKICYQYEYSQAALTLRKDILKGHRVLVVDDVLATGGTLNASLHLAKHNGASEVFGAVLIELMGLNGKEKLLPYEIFSAIQYD